MSAVASRKVRTLLALDFIVRRVMGLDVHDTISARIGRSVRRVPKFNRSVTSHLFW